MTTWLALDVGDKRVGLATGNDTVWLAQPHGILHRRSKREDFTALAELARRVAADRFLIGLPYNMDGSEGPQARRVRNYARHLAHDIPLPITFWDERLSSFEADALHAEIGGSRKGRSYNDDVAAAFILQSYLDHLRRNSAVAIAANPKPL